MKTEHQYWRPPLWSKSQRITSAQWELVSSYASIGCSSIVAENNLDLSPIGIPIKINKTLYNLFLAALQSPAKHRQHIHTIYIKPDLRRIWINKWLSIFEPSVLHSSGRERGVLLMAPSSAGSGSIPLYSWVYICGGVTGQSQSLAGNKDCRVGWNILLVSALCVNYLFLAQSEAGIRHDSTIDQIIGSLVPRKICMSQIEDPKDWLSASLSAHKCYAVIQVSSAPYWSFGPCFVATKRIPSNLWQEEIQALAVQGSSPEVFDFHKWWKQETAFTVSTQCVATRLLCPDVGEKRTVLSMWSSVHCIIMYSVAVGDLS